MFRTRALIVALVVILILLFAAKRVMHAAAKGRHERAYRQDAGHGHRRDGQRG